LKQRQIACDDPFDCGGLDAAFFLCGGKQLKSHAAQSVD